MNLARRALKACKLLPSQPNRKQQFDVFVKEKIRQEIKAQRSASEMEIAALESIGRGEIEKKYPLREDSQMKNYLPSPKTFQLLDSEAQEILQQKRSPLRAFAAFISGNEKLRNV